MLVCTSICANYLPKAAVLAKTFLRHNPNGQFVLCLVERELPDCCRRYDCFTDIVLARDLGIEHFDQYIFKHDIVEASTSVKGALFQYLYRRYPQQDRFVYLDPDIKVFGPLVELEEALKSKPIILTPHLCHPESTLATVVDNELCALRHGVFNLGFLAVSRSEEAERFINWWAARLAMFCYNDIPNGIFTDQKWLDLAPCLFDVLVLRHPGYNLAPWNISRRSVEEVESGQFAVNGSPLRFFHFSGFDSGGNEMMVRRYIPDKNHAIYRLRDTYLEELNDLGQATVGKTPWTYATYASGEAILKEARIRFRNDLSLADHYGNPFLRSNGTFLGAKASWRPLQLFVPLFKSFLVRPRPFGQE